RHTLKVPILRLKLLRKLQEDGRARRLARDGPDQIPTYTPALENFRASMLARIGEEEDDSAVVAPAADVPNSSSGAEIPDNHPPIRPFARLTTSGGAADDGDTDDESENEAGMHVELKEDDDDDASDHEDSDSDSSINTHEYRVPVQQRRAERAVVVGGAGDEEVPLLDEFERAYSDSDDDDEDDEEEEALVIKPRDLLEEIVEDGGEEVEAPRRLRAWEAIASPDEAGGGSSEEEEDVKRGEGVEVADVESRAVVVVVGKGKGKEGGGCGEGVEGAPDVVRGAWE
ncbi:hypothetical protein BDK51DRAFT_45864, partial [Blyttiomyces helicus]